MGCLASNHFLSGDCAGLEVAVRMGVLCYEMSLWYLLQYELDWKSRSRRGASTWVVLPKDCAGLQVGLATL